MWRYIWLGVAIAGFVFMIGTLGSSDTGAIGWSETVWRLLISFLCFSGGMAGMWICDRRM